MAHEIKLPELQQSYLSPQLLQAYAADLLECAVIFDLQLKLAAEAYVADSGASLSLDEALGALERREVLGLQVRYMWQEQAWWDTLMWTPEGLRLVRISPQLPHEAREA